MLKKLEIAILIVTTLMELISLIHKLRLSSCDICGDKKRNFKLLEDGNHKICQYCASHYNDIGVEI